MTPPKKKKINESCYTNGEELTSEKEQEGKMELDQGTGGKDGKNTE